MAHRRIRVAIVEEETRTRPSVRACIAADNTFEVSACGTPDHVLSTITKRLPDIVVLDTLGYAAQRQALDSLATVANGVPILVLTVPGEAAEHLSGDSIIETMNREQTENKNDIYNFQTMLLIRLKNLGFRRPLNRPFTTQAPYDNSRRSVQPLAKKNSASSQPTRKTEARCASGPPTRSASGPPTRSASGPPTRSASGPPTRSATQKAGPPSTCLIAIGASLGGVEATKELLCKLDPERLPGIVVVQHMKVGFTAEYARQLNFTTPFRVREAKNGDLIEDGLVLIAEGGKQFTIKYRHSRFMVCERKAAEVGGFCPSVDVLFKSVASVAGTRAVGIILTGIGHDGSEGLKQMHDVGCHTWGQSEKSCAVYGMPLAAKKLGAVDIEADLSGIARGVQRYFRDYARSRHDANDTKAAQEYSARPAHRSTATQTHKNSQVREDT